MAFNFSSSSDSKAVYHRSMTDTFDITSRDPLVDIRDPPLKLNQSGTNGKYRSSTVHIHNENVNGNDSHSMSSDSLFATISPKHDLNHDEKLPKGVQEIIAIESPTPSWRGSKESNSRKNALETEDLRPRHKHYRSVTPPDITRMAMTVHSPPQNSPPPIPVERRLSRQYKPRKLDPPQTGCTRSGISGSTNSPKRRMHRHDRKRKKMTRSKSNVLDAKRTGRPYHEKQEWEMCLMHALNALFQRKKFTTDHMDTICNTLAPDKLINPHKSIFRTGNYDANVLMMALHQEGVDVQWFDSRKAQSDLSLNDDFLCPKDKYSEFLGFIVNNQQKKMLVFNRRHWLTIKKIKGVWYDLDSKNAAPKPLKEKELMDRLITACNNDAQLMICRKRRVHKKEKEEEEEHLESKEDGMDHESMRGSNHSKQKRYSLRNRNVIPLQTPSQTDLEDLDDSETSTQTDLEDGLVNGNGYGHVHSKSSGTLLCSVDASEGIADTLDASSGFKAPQMTQHISWGREMHYQM